ncbi:MAG: YIP1 family protein [Anaerolineae bacterium]
MATIVEERKSGSSPVFRNILTRPGKVWQAAGRRIGKAWWLGAMLILAMVLVRTYVQTLTEAEDFYEIQLYAYEHTPEKERAYMTPPDLIMAPPVTVIIRAVGHVSNTVVGWLAWVAALALILSFLGRKSPGFASLLKVVIWAWVPILIRGLVQTAYMLITKDAIFNLGLSGLIWDQRPEPPPMLMGIPGRPIHYPTQREMALAGFLERIDIYTGWHLVLMALGLSSCAQTERRKTLIAVIVSAIVLAALAALPTLFGRALGRFRFF